MSRPDAEKARQSLEGLNQEMAAELAQAALDVAGVADPTPISDVLGAGLSLYRRDFVGAGLSLISVVPYAGDALAKTAKGTRAAKKINALRKQIEAVTAELKLAEKLAVEEAPAAARAARKATRAQKAVEAKALTRCKSIDPDNKLWKDYLKDVAEQTGTNIGRKQRQKLKEYLTDHTPKRLSVEQTAERRDLFSSRKNRLIKEWEENTGQKWPTYPRNILSQDGKIYRKKGSRYDAHELIENSYGSPHEWWNIHPAAAPKSHQGGIHRAGGPASVIFPD